MILPVVPVPFIKTIGVTKLMIFLSWKGTDNTEREREREREREERERERGGGGGQRVKFGSNCPTDFSHPACKRTLGLSLCRSHETLSFA